ncbi:MAG: NADH-ubiquinone oxidoreductase-F iron-sulfur binding region domain-containing protein [Brevefilum sp.]|nr:NADH-ubiquinone oxidoreductase-F iron-sulfur binding region domain-containing protein [Brevefilum sp.]MDT8381096.1 NADH-ubiquinone oxidoreductase-F iron-sulfur binding region domain-containing protein [Brevefilum sp.]MDW7754200.1 NADH-ubiquinone oxidoreductase-F iron-sulfur binding region domain-containing protein [Brevefilum sp.]
MAYFRSHVLVSVDPVCVQKGAYELIETLQDEIVKQGLVEEVQVLETSRIGDPETEGLDLMVYPEAVHYTKLTLDDVPFLVEEQFLKGRIAEQYIRETKKVVDEELSAPKTKEVRIVLKNIGEIDPLNIEDYIARDGYMALGKVLTEMTPEETIQEVLDSGLRGRGGAGFPTGLKWRFIRNAEAEQKYMICNADEGDPGAFANRRVLEGDPHSVVEGMIIGAYAAGASQGYIYCRAEYPIAVRTMKTAIEQARNFGLLGDNILGSGFSFDLEVRMGAGAFVCGEETALMASIEGLRGEPRPRPPFPAQKGLWEQPSNINNVETYSNVPQIILKGAEWFSSLGYKKSTGTKTFSMAGDVKNTGLIEVPFGITLQEIIYDVGGGIKEDKKFKAVQTGGPMGGCLPENLLDLHMDYEALAEAGSILGSGGLVVMDEDTCMVDIARFFMDFTQDESCGKCTPCRIGTRRILEILTRICEGKGKPDDIDTLRYLCDQINENSLCGLGKGAPNPVKSTLEHFLDEYEAHIYEKRCPAKVCKSLIRFEIIDGLCTGCTLCARNCPVDAISGERRQTHVIDPDICIKCGICEQLCPYDAIEIK